VPELCPHAAQLLSPDPGGSGRTPRRDRIRMGRDGLHHSPSELRSLTLYPAELRAQIAEGRDSKRVRGPQEVARRSRLCPNCAPTVPRAQRELSSRLRRLRSCAIVVSNADESLGGASSCVSGSFSEGTTSRRLGRSILLPSRLKPTRTAASTGTGTSRWRTPSTSGCAGASTEPEVAPPASAPPIPTRSSPALGVHDPVRRFEAALDER